jgi:Uma2 family endonuclease
MTMTLGVLHTVVRADYVDGPPQGQWTGDDLDRLPADGFRYEIIDGVLYLAPPPVPEHQGAARWFVYHLTRHVRLAGLGAVYPAPIGVVLGPGTELEPDVVVILKGSQRAMVGEKKIMGAPDLVIEIASPSTAAYDRDAVKGKQAAYARAGVPEYWLAVPAARTIEVLVLVNGVYESVGVFQGDDRLPAGVLPTLPVAVREFFAADDL